MGDISDSVKEVGYVWERNPYYERAEKLLYVFWNDESKYKQLFSRLDLSSTVELAAGHGRHAEIVAPLAGEMIVMDIHDSNLAACRSRLGGFGNVSFLKCDGFAFDGVADSWATSIYCYDSMVHFAPDVVKSYIKDTYRVLVPGGMALYHHSNYMSPGDQVWTSNPHGRNNMTRAIFVESAAEAGLSVLESTPVKWGGISDLDCVTLLRKPKV